MRVRVSPERNPARTVTCIGSAQRGVLSGFLAHYRRGMAWLAAPRCDAASRSDGMRVPGGDVVTGRRRGGCPGRRIGVEARTLLAACLLVVGAFGLPPARDAEASGGGPSVEWISRSVDGSLPSSASSQFPSLSADGRRVAFRSQATNLVPNDTNGVGDIFVRDVVTQETTLASVADNESQTIGSFGANSGGVISADGSHVAFVTRGLIIAGQYQNNRQVWLRDLWGRSTALVSVSLIGGEPNGAASPTPSVSGDGRYVAYQSDASDLVAGDTNGQPDVFVRDMELGTTTMVSVGVGGVAANGGSYAPSISGNGRRVAFVSVASNLVPGDTNGVADAFVRDLDAGTTGRVGVASDGSQPNAASEQPDISGDGGTVAFRSAATNLVAGDTNGVADVFVRDLDTGATTLASVNRFGAVPERESYSPSLSDDGDEVAFGSMSSQLVPGDTNGWGDVFVRHRVTGATERVSVTYDGGQANHDVSGSMSGDGRWVGMDTGATNMVPVPVGCWGNACHNVFLAGASAVSPPALPFRYAALGDSYSAGVGLPSTPSECLRPPRGVTPGPYARQVWTGRPEFSGSFGESEFRFLACSGKTADQVRQEQVSLLDPSIDLVTVTAGGNDVGFANILLLCLVEARCDTWMASAGSGGRDLLSVQIANAYPDLVALYTAIKARAPYATVQVLGYPQVVAPASNRRAGCLPAMDDDEIGFIRDHTLEMNQVIHQAAQAAGVRFVDVVDEFDSVLGGACGDAPKLNEVTFPNVFRSFHPNQAGYDAYFAALAADGATSRTLPANPTPVAVTPPQAGTPSVNLQQLIPAALGSCAVAGVLRPGCPVRVLVDGLAAGTAQLVMHSEPTVVASVTVGVDGVAAFEFELPDDTDIGSHILEVDEPGEVDGTRVVGVAAIAVAELPGAPTSLTALPSDGEATLTWDPPADTGGIPLEGYTIYRDGTLFQALGDPAAITFTDSALTNGQTYSYRVAARNAAGESAPSSPVSVTPNPPAGVSGTVTESGSGLVVAGAWVAVLRTSDFSVAGGGVADGSGNFAAEVPPGSYYLYVVDPTGAHTAGFHGPPTTVTVTSGATTDADPQMASMRGAIAGTVTETGSGTPIGGAWVIGINAATGATQRGAVANGSGQYNIAGLTPGSYRPVFVDPTGEHGSRYFPNSVDFPGATSLAVTAGGSTAANVALPTQSTTPGAQTLSGTVREAGTNAALGGVFVVALRASDFRNAGGAVTNAAGQYSLNVAAGDYKLAFIDSTGGHNMEWHDNQPNTGLATATSVTAPAVTNSVLDANTGTMAGTITDDPSGNPLAGAWVIAIGPSGAIAGGAVTAANGTYTIAGLAPGTYRATIVDPNGGRTQEYFNNSPDYAGSIPITITAANTATIDAALALP